MTALENIVARKIELATKSIIASFGWDVTNVSANSERGEQVKIIAPFENASGNNNILHVSNVIEETRRNIADKVSELLAPKTHFDRQSHTHHINTNRSSFTKEMKKNCLTIFKTKEKKQKPNFKLGYLVLTADITKVSRR